MALASKKVSRKRVPSGTTLRVQVGTRTLLATVVEDMGPVRSDGEHLVRVRGPLAADAEPSEFDVSVPIGELPL